MGLALVFFLICLVIGGIAFCFSKYDSPKNGYGKAIKHASIGVFIAILVIGGITTAIIVGISYSGYLENRAFYDATVEQYRGAIKMYGDYAVIDMKKTQEAFTDLKYQGYQKEMANMILCLRRSIIKYNHSFILKKIKNASWFFNWYIIANDSDMKIIRMIEEKES